MKIYKGRTAEVLRGRTSSTNGGQSDMYDELILVGEGIPENTQGNEDNQNVLKLVKRTIFGREHIHAEPVNKKQGLVGSMFGGNYLKCVGSMYGDIKYPIAIHDRYETPADYSANFD